MGGKFLAFWAGQTTSVFGTAISQLALPSVAILSLSATPTQIGILRAASFAAFPLVGLFAGVWADRTSRRALMLGADLIRLVLLAAIPLAAVAGRLSFLLLVVVAAAVGIASVFFDVAYGAFVPALVGDTELDRANARLETTYSAARIGGDMIGGVLIAVAGAPLAVGIDALTYLASLAALAPQRVPEPSPGVREPMLPAIRAGLAVVTRSPVLSRLATTIALNNLGWGVVSAVELLFFYQTLRLSPVLVGVLLAIGNLGFAAIPLAPLAQRRLGTGRLLVLTALGSVAAAGLLPLAVFAPIPLIVASQLAFAICVPVFNVTQVTMRQRMVAPELRGRMTASMRVIVWGTFPIGALAGGALGSQLGVVPALAIAALLCGVSVPPLLTAPIRALDRSVAASAA